MERMCGFSMDDYADKALMSPECLIMPTDDHYSDQSLLFSGDHHRNISPFGSERESGSTANISESGSIAPEIHHHHHHHHHQRSSRRDIHGYDEETCKAIKTQIASHPLYPKLLDAYIDCQKVGAPPEITTLLEEIKQESSGLCRRDGTVATTCLGDDPELDEFMETYCEILVKYKLDLERPFDEATTFLNQIQIQLGNLGKDDSSEEEFEGGGGGGGGGENTEEQEYRLRNEEDREIKERLLRKYGDRLSALKIEFSKKKKKGKLPKEARQALLQWWNAHYKWPYPTESDKIYLAETTGLDQKQINNWFINQRKRHWKPSDNMQFGFMGNCSGQFIADD